MVAEYHVRQQETKICAVATRLTEFAYVEYALWKNQEGQMQSLMQAVTESATCIIESTTKGLQLLHKYIYAKARNGENDFKPFFFNWINGRTLFEPQYKLAVKSWKARHNGKMLTEDEV